MLHATQNYLTTLTPLRGIAALLVVIFHSNLMVQPFLPPGYTRFVEFSWLWVDFFFILSGFILTYVYGRDFEQRVQKANYWKYIGARFARVYPLHLFTMIWVVICTIFILYYAHSLDPFFADIFNLEAIPTSLLFLQSLHLYSAAPLNTPSWSLSTEWWMYMIFPFLVPLFVRLRSGGRWLVFLLIAAYFVFLKFVIGPISGPFKGNNTINLVADFGLLRCIGGFLLGMLLHSFYQERIGYRILSRSITFLLFSFATVGAMHFGWDELLIVLLFPFILLTAAYNTTGVKRILDKKPLQLLGDWSFSIYMVHVPIAFIMFVFTVRENPNLFADFMALIQSPPDYQLGVISLIVLVASTLVVASLTYRLIEVPARKYINKRLSARTENTTKAEVAAAP